MICKISCRLFHVLGLHLSQWYCQESHLNISFKKNKIKNCLLPLTQNWVCWVHVVGTIKNSGLCRFHWNLILNIAHNLLKLLRLWLCRACWLLWWLGLRTFSHSGDRNGSRNCLDLSHLHPGKLNKCRNWLGPGDTALLELGWMQK